MKSYREHLHNNGGQLKGGRHAAELERAAAKLGHPQPLPCRAHQVTQLLPHAAQILRTCAGTTLSHALSAQSFNKSHECSAHESLTLRHHLDADAEITEMKAGVNLAAVELIHHPAQLIPKARGVIT